MSTENKTGRDRITRRADGILTFTPKAQTASSAGVTAEIDHLLDRLKTSSATDRRAILGEIEVAAAALTEPLQPTPKRKLSETDAALLAKVQSFLNRPGVNASFKSKLAKLSRELRGFALSNADAKNAETTRAVIEAAIF